MIRFVIFALCLITVNSISKASSTTIQKSDHDQEEECAYPRNAITVEKNEYPYQAWNKCIDLADSVFPCLKFSNSSTKKNRIEMCGHIQTPLIPGTETEAMPNEFPHTAALGYVMEQDKTISWNCGGTLISDQWVMAPAHCISHYRVMVSKVKLGETELSVADDPQSLFDVVERVKHPDFKRPKIYNDIALLKLDRRATYSIKIRPACLDVGNVNDNTAIAIGFGPKYPSFENYKLFKAETNKLSKEECSDIFRPERKYPNGIVDTQICYHSKMGSEHTCQGISEGSLQIYNNGVHCTYTVIGISSVGKRCVGFEFPEIYTKVSAFVPWIESVVWPN